MGKKIYRVAYYLQLICVWHVARLITEFNKYKMEKERGIKIINVDKTKQCDIHVVVKSFGCGWNFCNAVVDKKGVASCDKCNRYK